MEREEVANAVLWPIDQTADIALRAVESVGVLAPASDLAYRGVRSFLRSQFQALNDLEVMGADNVPPHGGVILASNHQSWMDVQVLAAACPRRVHFMAKSEFERWPVLRHLIRLSQSVYVHRGGDDVALESLVEALRSGWAVAIYPEGTIPGEEDVPRVAVDPETGLLPGRTGVVRLALKAGVPIVPVGVSGTGRAFPPEIYPRLELLRMPAATPVRIRFGAPMSLEAYRDQPQDRKLYREITNELMRQISALVDHRCNYVPLDVPLPQPPKREKIGVLLLHGFTSHLNTVNGLVPYLKDAGISFEMPILRGHGTRYQDLRGVTAGDWYVDAERALINLWNYVDRIVVVGLSMGGLVALDLATRHPDKIAGIVTVGACLKFADPLVRFTGALSNVFRYWPSPESFNDLSLKVNCKNYPKFPTDAFASLYEYSQQIARRLRDVHVPILILQSKKDQIVAPESANIIYEKVSSMHREIIWYHKSGHEMMQDLEAAQVFHDVMEYVHRFELSPRVDSAQAG
ncbi:MAG: alpha/beta fold hydrolase [Deltaproteobacteria bacterium]|nr:alpha/beta fold hydrolase [Deltaproteobacteria bacterium]